MTEIRRRPWLAAILSLFAGPIGQVYGGAARRAVLLWLIGVAISVAAIAGVTLLPISPLLCISLIAIGVGMPLVFAVDAFCLVRKRRTMERKIYQRWWVYGIAFLFFATGNHTTVLFVRSFITEAFVIPSQSMCNTLLPGDKILTSKMYYHFHPVARGDVAVFCAPEEGSSAWVKRVVALPGDRIEIRNEQVYLNGERLVEPYTRFQGPKPPLAEMIDTAPMTIPEGHVFVLGDNRRVSLDSRRVGPIALNNLTGRPAFIYWSVKRHSPGPPFTNHYTVGVTRWNRIGMRIQ